MFFESKKKYQIISKKDYSNLILKVIRRTPMYLYFEIISNLSDKKLSLNIKRVKIRKDQIHGEYIKLIKFGTDIEKIIYAKDVI
ncbi:hypothetical protein [Clostridioides sp. ZZV15-6597]|uniref:hypothetical protein n=1 Tax=Clostridioides sp. ZZV15-6597 TaxID=2811500 RepID=UPI001D123FCD|nr:hypothetical protein [Clostridioides sp. ZZV15-6597]